MISPLGILFGSQYQVTAITIMFLVEFTKAYVYIAGTYYLAKM